eukprot:scaffold257103_cov15-Tisochrysis_lutea.AAC.1
MEHFANEQQAQKATKSQWTIMMFTMRGSTRTGMQHLSETLICVETLLTAVMKESPLEFSALHKHAQMKLKAGSSTSSAHKTNY